MKKLRSLTNIVKLIEVRQDLLKKMAQMKSNQDMFGRNVFSFILKNKVRPVRSFKNIESYNQNDPIVYFLIDYIREESALFRRISYEKEFGKFFNDNPNHNAQIRDFINKKKARMNHLLSRYLVSIDESIKVEVFGRENDFEFVLKIENWGHFWIKRMPLKANYENLQFKDHNIETLTYLKLNRSENVEY